MKISKPTTVEQVLRNIRYAIDHNLLLTPETYTEDHLTLLFGGTSVLWAPYDRRNRIQGDIRGLDTIVAPTLLDGIRVNAFTIDFVWRSMAPQKRVANLHLKSSASADVRFDDVVHIFGPNWKKAPPDDDPHREYDKVTRPHGNARILYDLRVGGATYRVHMEFHGNASIYTLTVTAEEEI